MHLVYEIIIEYFWKISSYLYLANRMILLKDNALPTETLGWKLGFTQFWENEKMQNGSRQPVLDTPRNLSLVEKKAPNSPHQQNRALLARWYLCQGDKLIECGMRQHNCSKICKSLMKLNVQGLAGGGWHKLTTRKEKRTCYSVKA